MRIPRSLIFKQDNRGDTLGDLYSSYNLNLSNNLGALQISPRMILAENSSVLTNMGVPCAFRFFTANGNDDVGTASRFIWAVAGTRIFHSNAGANGAWKQDATGGSPTALNSDLSDMALFNGAMYALS